MRVWTKGEARPGRLADRRMAIRGSGAAGSSSRVPYVEHVTISPCSFPAGRCTSGMVLPIATASITGVTNNDSKGIFGNADAGRMLFCVPYLGACAPLCGTSRRAGLRSSLMPVGWGLAPRT